MKIFGIGLSKTGTSSLTKALKILGYKNSIHNPSQWLSFRDPKGLTFDYSQLDDVDSATDIEIAYYYKQLDRRYPGSKFILTTRDVNGWLKSCENHFNDVLTSSEAEKQLHKALYGSSVFNRERFRSAYSNHVDDVLDYFRDRDSDLLVLPIGSDSKMTLLEDFLGIKGGSHAYPAANKAFPLPIWVKSRLRRFPLLMKLRNQFR
ncbi:sulfotransferase [uncultured Microbulbifer sp.]|uniref:sulfotransferase n=1 Tax=uncultured Microbulbifer sp. TaxID=348147 RepID=UPI00262D7634|nr:sulfotransferase [uncultured Microbulbifer sp.]